MLFRERLIKALNDRFCGKVVNVQFRSDIKGDLISEGSEPAVNSFDSDREEVLATQWYGDYWFFVRIQIPYPNAREAFVSVSFFQKVEGLVKQLFRAEWYSYSTKEGYNHPQPHWHFTAQLSDITSFSDLENIEEENDYSKMAGNSKEINLDKMHFAMTGDWMETGQMINKQSDENLIVSWLEQLFVHVRHELECKDK